MERYIGMRNDKKKLHMIGCDRAWPSGYPLSDMRRKIFDMLISRIIVGDQPVGPVTNLWEQRFESVFVFPDEYRTILTWAAPLKIPGIFVRGQQSSRRDRNSNSSNRVNMHIELLGWS